MDQEKELFLSFRKIGSLPGKVNFLLPETKGLFVCLVFLPRCPSPQLNFIPILFLLFLTLNILNILNILVSVYQKEGTCPPFLNFWVCPA